MRAPRFAPFALGALIALGATASREAPLRAAPPASPSLSTAASRQVAREAVARIAMTLAMDKRVPMRDLEALYVAFDPSATDLVALAACDDDGDPVVVLSDAMLGLVDFAAQARAMDDVLGTNKVRDYALFLAQTEKASARLLPPPPGFFDKAQTNDPRVRARAVERRDEAIAGLVAHEMAHVAQGDITCPHPTATREIGDATWTPSEARAAVDAATRAYGPARVLSADALAVDFALASAPAKDPTHEEAYVAVLTLFDQLPSSLYAKLHQVPGTTSAGAVRIGVVRAAAIHWREHAAAPSNGHHG